MSKTLLTALAAVTLCINAGCCRGWFIWPGHYPHSPSFSPCSEKPKLWPFNLDPFEKEDLRTRLQSLGRRGQGRRTAWGRGNWGGGGGYFGGHCGWGCGPCEGGHGMFSPPSAPVHGYPGHAGMGHAGMGHPGMGHPGMGYPGMGYPGMGYPGMGYPGMGYPGAVSPEGIPLQAAPNAMSAGQVAYPYYTNRGPRDFLQGYPPGTQPPSIGP